MYINRAQRMLDLAAIKAASLNAMVILTTKVFLSDADMLVAATVKTVGNESAYSGYARKTAQAFSNPLVNPQLTVEMLSGNQTFIATGTPTPEQIFGYAVLDSTTNNVLFAERFAAPINVNVAGDGTSFVLRYDEQQSTTGGVVVV